MDAMRGISGPSVQALAEKFDFSKYQTLCDVGCASAGPPPRSITARTVPAAFCWKLQWTCQLRCLSQVSSVIGCTRAQPQLASDI